jgi:hypothetical protein
MNKTPDTPITAKPVPNKLTFWQQIKCFLPRHCGYCGKTYVSCHSKEVSLLFPVPVTGRCCPDGHMGYVDQMLMTGDVVRYRIDNVKQHEAVCTY